MPLAVTNDEVTSVAADRVGLQCRVLVDIEAFVVLSPYHTNWQSHRQFAFPVSMSRKWPEQATTVACSSTNY